MKNRPGRMCLGEPPDSELKELGEILIRDRVWVWPDNLDSSDANIGSFKRPLRTLESGKGLTRYGVDLYCSYFPIVNL